jgi:hypothetical protein
VVLGRFSPRKSETRGERSTIFLKSRWRGSLLISSQHQRTVCGCPWVRWLLPSAPQTVRYVTHSWRQLGLRFDRQHANHANEEENLSEPENPEPAAEAFD